MAAYGQSTGAIALDSLGCTGTEARLVDCSYQPGTACTHSQDAGVDCSTTCKHCSIYTNAQNHTLYNIYSCLWGRRCKACWRQCRLRRKSRDLHWRGLEHCLWLRLWWQRCKCDLQATWFLQIPWVNCVLHAITYWLAASTLHATKVHILTACRRCGYSVGHVRLLSTSYQVRQRDVQWDGGDSVRMWLQHHSQS